MLTSYSKEHEGEKYVKKKEKNKVPLQRKKYVAKEQINNIKI